VYNPIKEFGNYTKQVIQHEAKSKSGYKKIKDFWITPFLGYKPSFNAYKLLK